MKRFFQQNGGILLIIAFLLSLLIAILSATTGGSFNPLATVIRTAITPVQTATASLVNWGQSVSDYVFRYDELMAQLDALQLENAQLEAEVREAQDANRENELFRELLNLTEKRSDFVLESARVSARKNSNWDDSFSISKGSTSGIEVGDCVITAEGYLLGVISQVTPTSSTVYTLVDPHIELGGMVSRTYATGILQGSYSLISEGKLLLSYLSDDAQLLPGDEVVTSGMGEQYPSGLVVGTVEGLFDDPSGTSRYATIIPTANLDDLIQVFVIKDFQVEE